MSCEIPVQPYSLFQKLHHEMLSDRPRTLAYQTAIQRNAKYLKDKVCQKKRQGAYLMIFDDN